MTDSLDAGRPEQATAGIGATTRPNISGWGAALAKISMGLLLFEVISGLAITFSSFNAAIQWGVIFHTVGGICLLLPLAWYCGRHWLEYRSHAWSQLVLLGYVGTISLFVCSASGAVITWQGFFGIKTAAIWRRIHLISTFAVVIGVAPHVLFAALKAAKNGAAAMPRKFAWQTVSGVACGLLLTALMPRFYSGTNYQNRFPADYSFLYGAKRPFAPSLARTDTGGAFDARSLSGSMSCGTVGCHEQILQEWKPSAHRYAAMDSAFMRVQDIMAKQNGPESTRYCGGCHDPISLFSGTKNLFAKNLTGQQGYQEGVSCMVCHGIRATDIKGNANYTITQLPQYLWQWEVKGVGKIARDFLIRAYPAEHNKLAKRAFKKPEYCAACHKQFIDQEVNRVGWVQLQNQYDNWAASHWNHKGDVRKTVECRECHMPLVDSHDPAAGDATDYNRTPTDGKHRSHRFIAANQLMPVVLKDNLEGWQEHLRLTEQWLQGRMIVPEIRDKWAEGPIVKLALSLPESVSPGETIPLRVTLASNKVGHDFPTGPLDIIQSWLEVTVSDETGHVIFTSGKRDEKHFIQPGSFLFKAEPVDQNGNLIDRHNLWEMVGVRYRRALFPGYSDTVQYSIPCSGAQNEAAATSAQVKKEHVELSSPPVPAPAQPGKYSILVALNYRKVDQFLLNYLFGEQAQLTAPVTELTRATATVLVQPRAQAAAPVNKAAALADQR